MKLPITLAIATALLSTFIACSQQGQGERCLTANGNADCEAGLVCTPKEELRESEGNAAAFAADRCCPPIDGPQWSDPRCEPGTRGTPATPATGGSGNSPTSGGAAGNAASAQAGATTSPGEGGTASTDLSTAAAGNGTSTDPGGITTTAGAGA